MTKVSSVIEDVPYSIEIRSPSGNTLISDEPESNGGKDTGFSPKELLAASLAACTSATLKIFAERKNWDLKSVKLSVELLHDDVTNETVLDRKITLVGELSDEQKTVLMKVANSCPIHKILTHSIKINTAEV